MLGYYVGIDPGAHGAIAILAINPLDPSANREEVHATPYTDGDYDEGAMRQILSMIPPVSTLVALEKVHAMPGQGVCSMFTFGMGFGIWRGMLSAFQLPYILVTPQRWKKKILEGEPKGEKESAIRVARRLFPRVSLRATSRSRTDHIGMAEALCLAEYARRSSGILDTLRKGDGC